MMESSSSSASDDHHHHHHVIDEFNPNPPDINSQHSRRPNLSSLQIPERSLEGAASTFTRIDVSSASSPSSVRAGLPPRPNSAKFKSTVKNLLPQRSFKAKNPSQDIEKTVLIIPDIPTSDGSLNRSSTSSSFSLNKMFFTSSTKATNSLPVTPNASSDPHTSAERHLDSSANPPKPEVHRHMTRSFSVPVNIKSRSLRRTDSGGLIRVISATPRPESIDHTSQKQSSAEIVNEDAGEDIPEEEAVCRICMVELSEGGDTLKMECSCKGDLALAHQECAVKWFSIKGNKTCDICKQEVRNLSVTLLKIHNPRRANRRPQNTQQQREVTRYRVWQDVPVLVMVSMLAYFCFLEQLLVSDLGPRALAISLPFACFLGLLSSMIASTMVSRSYIWAYASFQFAIVILFAHIFYTVLNVNAILSILLSSFTGFGIAISTNSLLMEYLRWRANRQPQSSHQDRNRTLQEQQQLQQPHLVQQQRLRDHRPQENHQNHQDNQNHHQHRPQHPIENSNGVQSDISSQPQETVQG